MSQQHAGFKIDPEFVEEQDSLHYLKHQVAELAHMIAEMASQPIQTDRQQIIAKRCTEIAEQLEQTSTTHRLDDLEVQRIVVRDPQGMRRLTIHNKNHCPELVINQATVHAEGGRQAAGMIFFNNEGVECGGLVFGGQPNAHGELEYSAGMMFDQYLQDQTVGITYIDYPNHQRAGLMVWDQPKQSMSELQPAIVALREADANEASVLKSEMKAKNQLPAQRVFIGKDNDKNAAIELHDAQGQIRARLVVEAEGQAYLEFLDEHGDSTARLPANN